VPTLFAIIGPSGVALVLAGLYAALLLFARRKSHA